jgi:hypothetical protein
MLRPLPSVRSVVSVRFTLVLSLAVAAAAWLAPDSYADAQARMPGPAYHTAPLRSLVAAADNARCETCHQDIAREWRGSMHAQADTDLVYRRALALEPLPFCRGCHAPEADAQRDAPAPLSALGIGCVTCHVPELGPNASTLASTASTSPSSSPHPVTRSPAFATAAACASCHEFDFPRGALGASQPPEKMQGTLSEHAASRWPEAPCASCHMPSVAGTSGQPHRSHSFAAHADLAMLRSAVRVSVERASPSQVIVTLAPSAVGHAFPTGDLFRRLVVSAEAVDDDWLVLGEASRSLHRRFEMREIAPGQLGRHLVGDDRVGVQPENRLRLELGERAPGRAIAWRVEYQRVEHPVGSDESNAVVADSVIVAEGVIPKVGETTDSAPGPRPRAQEKRP